MNQTKDADGNVVKIGDVVEFKCDIEQVGKVVAISRSCSGRIELTLESDGFSGEYIGGDTRTVQDADRCYLI